MPPGAPPPRKTGGPSDRLAERIRREGPIPFDAFVDLALYDDGGFFEQGRGAGRAGRDFVTSPEVGPLFGALVARALDGWWDELDRPDPYFVVEAGAGRGRLAADVLAAFPRSAPALRYVLVERSPTLQASQRELVALEPIEDAIGPMEPGDGVTDAIPVTGSGPIATSLGELPAMPLTGVVLANELLDNLPFRVVQRGDGDWSEVRVGRAGAGFEEALVPASAELAAEAELIVPAGAPVGTRLPVPTGMREWIRSCVRTLRRGLLVVIDYAATGNELVERGHDGWLRTYREHARGGPVLEAPGTQDITADVPIEYLMHIATRYGLELTYHGSQREWLGTLGIDELITAARAAWHERAHIGDLEALRQRSRVSEAAALTDPEGLGAHRVVVFRARM